MKIFHNCKLYSPIKVFIPDKNFIKTDSSKIKYISDEFIKNLTSKVQSIKPREINSSIIIDNKEVGTCTYRIIKQNTFPNRYPQSWNNESFLWLENINVTDKRKGYGRETIKRLYLESIEQGAKGRIALYAINDSPNFYDKLGFNNSMNCIISKIKKNILPNKYHHYPCENGILYFEPTKNNIIKLFSK